MMEPTIIGNATLYCGDCLEILPTLEKVDAVITDPPYGLGEATGTISKQRSAKRNYSMFEDTEEYLNNVIIPGFRCALGLCGRAVITTGGKHAWNYPKPDVLGGFYQPAACGMTAWGRLTYQPVLFYGKDPMAGKTIKNITFTLTDKPSDDRHPCSKPIKAMNWMVDRGSMKDEIVLDPFMGSGTTGVACMNLGRKFIGIEIEPKYFDIACERIDQAQRQQRLFV